MNKKIDVEKVLNNHTKEQVFDRLRGLKVEIMIGNEDDTQLDDELGMAIANVLGQGAMRGLDVIKEYFQPQPPKKGNKVH